MQAAQTELCRAVPTKPMRGKDHVLSHKARIVKRLSAGNSKTHLTKHAMNLNALPHILVFDRQLKEWCLIFTAVSSCTRIIENGVSVGHTLLRDRSKAHSALVLQSQ